MNTERFTYFVWTKPSNASYGFNGYTDNEGNHKYIARGNDDRGNVLYRRFKFTPNKRVLSIPNAQADVLEFLRNHPECDGSPNGRYRRDNDGKDVQYGVVFKELNDGKDAALAIEAVEDKLEATSSVMEYKKAIEDNDPEKLKELSDLAILCGTAHTDPMLQLHHILQYAENSPATFMDKYKDPTKKARALVRRGLKSDSPYLRRKGFMVYWQDVHLGNDEDSAVQFILRDEKLMEAIEHDANKTK